MDTRSEIMWTYVIAFLDTGSIENAPFIMVRSRKRGGWEMPGGRMEEGEDPLSSAVREFLEETGRNLQTWGGSKVPYKGGFVFFGTSGRVPTQAPLEHEISEVSWFRELPEDLAYPQEEYIPLIEKGRRMLVQARNGIRVRSSPPPPA